MLGVVLDLLPELEAPPASGFARAPGRAVQSIQLHLPAHRGHQHVLATALRGFAARGGQRRHVEAQRRGLEVVGGGRERLPAWAQHRDPPVRRGHEHDLLVVARGGPGHREDVGREGPGRRARRLARAAHAGLLAEERLPLLLGAALRGPRGPAGVVREHVEAPLEDRGDRQGTILVLHLRLALEGCEGLDQLVLLQVLEDGEVLPPRALVQLRTLVVGATAAA
mmetsp:Transcript_90860/g.257374  ORF Transcript_90860/g.257374 Transcript_90860/m.257374 type:complete len:224 (-) Transcript_90860:59-730(-)